MFSSLDGLSKMDEIAETLVELGQEHMAVADHGTCAGHYHLMNKRRPITFTLSMGSRATS